MSGDGKNRVVIGLLRSLALSAVGVGAPLAWADVLLVDQFDYENGDLSEVAPEPAWNVHSGTAAQTVADGRAFVNDNNSGDHNRQFTPVTSGTIYGGLTANVDPNDLPTTQSTATGGYFFHLANVDDAGVIGTGFRGRVWAIPGTEAGKIKFALSTTSGAVNASTTEDFDAGTDYRLVVSYDFATANSQLWVNPTSDDALATLTGTPEATASAGLAAVALRGASNDGDVFVDDVVIATTFAEARAVPEPAAALGTLGLAGALALGRRRRA